MQTISPYEKLKSGISDYLISRGFSEEDTRGFISDIPKKWEKFADVALLPNRSFKDEKWNEHRKELCSIIADSLGVKRIGRIGEIIGKRRESTVEILLGDDDWVIRKENGINYGYRFCKCMFSAGNVNERRRMGEVGRSGDIVVDLYAGIGYYSLPMLVFSEIAHMHSCEWNYESIKALRINLERNNVSDRCTIHEGDNRITTEKLRNIADRVILGLLPTAEDGYIPALDVLKKKGVLHIHGIAPAKDYDSWISKTLEGISIIRPKSKISEIGRYRIKSYAPHWDHLVIDVRVE